MGVVPYFLSSGHVELIVSHPKKLVRASNPHKSYVSLKSGSKYTASERVLPTSELVVAHLRS